MHEYLLPLEKRLLVVHGITRTLVLLRFLFLRLLRRLALFILLLGG